MKFELLRAKLKEGQESIEEISDLINLRFFRIKRVFDTLVSGDITASEKEWAEYAPTVEKWNTKLIICQNKIERRVSSNIASQLNNYETDNPELKEPVSLHGHFYVTHKKVHAVLECMKHSGDCKVTTKMKEEAAKSIRELDFVSDAFVDQVSQVFLKKTFRLEQFKFSANPGFQGTNEEAAHPLSVIVG